MPGLHFTPPTHDPTTAHLEERWYSTADVASILGITRNTVKLWINKGELNALLLPGAAGYRINASDLASFIRKREVRTKIAHLIADQVEDPH